MARTLFCVLGLCLVLAAAADGAPRGGSNAPVEHHAGRKVLKKVLPTYPELARQFDIKGVVKLQVTVAPNGTVKSAKALGGNPTFVEAAMSVIDKWKFEPTTQQTTETVELKFQPY